MADIYTMGADIGSAASKCLILKNGTELAGSAVISSGTGTSGPARTVARALEISGLTKGEISKITATGYGRNTMAEADYRVSELSCHAIGAYAVFPEVKTVIDIGGQDAKVLSIGDDGRLENFVMNDKCAAGTGRFLEVMARVLEVRVDELADLDAKSTKPVKISSTCTVFAESEVISYLANNVGISDLVAGIHNSAASRVVSLVRRLGFREPAMITGGVAQNSGVVRALNKELGTDLKVSPLAQLNGAYGAALYAWRQLISPNKGVESVSGK
jgi:predicted CoA-substrate-specific enzyme activase